MILSIPFFTSTFAIVIQKLLNPMFSLNNDTIIRGNPSDSSKVIYKKSNGTLIKGVELKDGSQIWFKDWIVSDFYDDRALVSKDWKFGFVDREGQLAVPMLYDFADNFSEGSAFATNMQNTFITDKNGYETYLSDEVLFNSRFHEGIAKVAKIDDTGNFRSEALVNTKGHFITPFDFVSSIRDGVDLFSQDDEVSEGLVRIMHKDYYGFLDTEGNMVIPAMYDKASKFHSGLAAVTLDDLAGFINHDNDFVVDPVFEDVAFVHKNYLFVKKDGNWGIITRSGEQVTDFIYNEFYFIKDGMLPAMHKGRWGLISLESEFKTAFRYSAPPNYHEGLIEFTEGRMRGVMDLKGNELISFLPQSSSSFIYN